MKELKASLETIRATANELINEIEYHFAELQKQREQETEQEAPAPETIYRVRANPYKDGPEKPISRRKTAGPSWATCCIPGRWENVRSSWANWFPGS